MLSVPLVSNTTAYFNPRSREGSDAAARIAAFEQGKFQSTLPRRERQQLLTKIAEVNGISIHAPAKGATSGRNRRRHRGPKFQSTLPRRERRRASCPSPRRSRYFNPRSREGSDAAGLHTAAPVRHFNPRSREGSDVPQDLHLLSALCISIHAPAKGATWQAVRSRRVSHFNPRSREGSDERPAQLWARLRHFNPRSREGSDRIAEPGTYDVASISIHAPAKGATIQPFWTAERSPVFQSTLPRRERRDIPTPKVTPRHEISIHAPAKGATPLASEVKQQLSISIHAPAKGATDNNRPRNACGFISIHAPAKGATSVR